MNTDYERKRRDIMVMVSLLNWSKQNGIKTVPIELRINKMNDDLENYGE